MLANLENPHYVPMIQHKLHTLFIPLTQNNGHPQPKAQLQQVQQELLQLAGGLTCYSPAQGLWLSPTTRQLYHDIVLPFQFVTTMATEQQVISLTVGIAERLGQEAIFLFSQPIWQAGNAVSTD